MSELTKQEAAWVARLQAVLDDCPSDRLGFYTTGDRDVSIYDRKKQKQIDRHMDQGGRDFGPSVDAVDAYLGPIVFPSNVHSTSG